MSLPRIEIDDERRLFASRLRDGPCFHEQDGLSWFASAAGEPWPVLDEIARAINPRASSTSDAPRTGEHLAWRIVIDPAAEPAKASQNTELARISTGATVTFLPRRSLRS